MPSAPDHAFRWTARSRVRNELTRLYEPLQPYVFAELARAAGCTMFVDVGANVGFYSIFMASELQADAVHAFEPMPAAFEELCANLALNGLEGRVSARRKAISSEVGEAVMAVFGDLSGANSVLGTSLHGSATAQPTERVGASTLDRELSPEGAVIALKIDVEGHEAAVLAGADALLRRNRVLIQVECYADGGAEDETEAALLRHGCRRLFAVGPDRYYATEGVELDVATAVERALARFVEASKRPDPIPEDPPLRRRVLRGVTVELSPRLAREVRRLF